MDKKLFNKSSNFFKREGFYVLLFVCLCIIATAVALTAKKRNDVARNQVTQQNNQRVTTPDTSSGLDYEGALQVRSKGSVIAEKSTQQTAQVSKTNNDQWTKPLNGKVAKGYMDEIEVDNSGTHWKRCLGYLITSNNDLTVKAALAGTVEKVDRTNFGVTVVIDHGNGYKTLYSNLDNAVALKAKDKVSTGQTIGKIGNTANYQLKDKYGDCLYFQVLKSKDNEEVDPAKYIKY